jgi:hypothetical protein
MLTKSSRNFLNRCGLHILMLGFFSEKQVWARTFSAMFTTAVFSHRLVQWRGVAAILTANRRDIATFRQACVRDYAKQCVWRWRQRVAMRNRVDSFSLKVVVGVLSRVLSLLCVCCLQVCVCVCVCMYTYINTFIHLIYICSIHTCMCVCVCVCILTYIHSHI